jgi:tetratricopeptide (TPR) repeat protein
VNVRRDGLGGALRILGTTTAAVGLVLTLLAWPRSGSSPAHLADASLGQFEARFATGSRESDISRLQARLRAFPEDWRAWASLGSAYVEQARVTASPTYYPKAEGALRKSLKLRAHGNDLALAGMGMLANARHDFAGGLAWAERAREVNPDRAGVYGILGDSLIELGRYDDAYAAIQRMVDLKPALPSYSRVAYVRELRGDVDGALQAFDMAAKAASNPSDSAFVAHQQAELHWHNGAHDKAAVLYERAVKLDPNFLPAKAGLARFHAAAGQIDRATKEYEQVIAATPVAQYVIELIDLHTTAGRPDLAAELVELLDVQEELLRANGVNVDLEIALFDADHGRDPAKALDLARAAYARQPNVFAADALAWALHVNGRHAEALPLADQALRLGTRNARFHFHRGMIELRLGQTDAARRDLDEALRLNPTLPRGLSV